MRGIAVRIPSYPPLTECEDTFPGYRLGQRGGGKGTVPNTTGSLRSKTVMVVQRLSGSNHSMVTRKSTPPSNGAMLLTVNLASPTKRCGAALEIGGCPSLAAISTIESCWI